MEASNGREHVYVELPVREAYARVLRLIVSGVASRMEFGLDAIDDLKMAVDEVFLMALGRPGVESVGVKLTPGDGGLEIVFDRVGLTGTESADSELPEAAYGRFILDAIVDEVEFVPDNGGQVRLVKRV